MKILRIFKPIKFIDKCALCKDQFLINMKRVTDGDESSPKRTCFDESAVAIYALSLCVQTLSLFETRPELRLQHVCPELRTLYRAHLRTTALQLANSHRAADAQLSWTQLSATIDESKSLAFASQNFEDAALQLRQISIRHRCSKIPFFVYIPPIPAEVSDVDRQAHLEVRSCVPQCQTQLICCAERHDIVTWARLMQILRPHITTFVQPWPPWWPVKRTQLVHEHFHMLYALLSSDSIVLCQNYLTLFLGSDETYLSNDELFRLVRYKKHFKSLESFPTQVLGYLAGFVKAAYCGDSSASLLGLWVPTGFFRQIIWPSVHTLDQAMLALQMIKPQYFPDIARTYWFRRSDFKPETPKACSNGTFLDDNAPETICIDDFLPSLIADLMDRTDNIELWKEIATYVVQIFAPGNRFGLQVAEILDQRFVPAEIPQPQRLEFVRWCLRPVQTAEQAWMLSFYGKANNAVDNDEADDEEVGDEEVGDDEVGDDEADDEEVEDDEDVDEAFDEIATWNRILSSYIKSFHFAALLISTDDTLGEDEKICAKQKLFATYSTQRIWQPLARELKLMSVSDCLQFCDQPVYLLYLFCYQTKHRTCSGDEYQQLRACIEQGYQAKQRSDDKWSQAFEFCTSLGKLRPQVFSELLST